MSMFRRRLLQQVALAVPKPIAAYECYDLTNEQLADSPILPDLSGNGHDIALRNFAWAGMSGIGGYQVNFTMLATVLPQEDYIDDNTYDKIYIKRANNSQVQYAYSSDITNCKIKVSGVTENISNGSIIYLKIYRSDLGVDSGLDITEDGEYEINISGTNGTNRIYIRARSDKGTLESPYELPVPIVIEQLPIYKGALVSDGVDDYGLTVKSLGNIGSFVALIKDINWANGTFLLNVGNGTEEGRLYCRKTSIGSIETAFPIETTPITNGFITYSRIPSANNSLMFLFGLSNGISACSVALYALEIYDRDLTDAEIAKVKARMIKQYESKTGLKYEEA